VIKIFMTHNDAALQNYFGHDAYSKLTQLGDVSYCQQASETTPNDIIQQAKDCEILVSYRIPPIDASLIAALPQLKAICRVAVDIRNIDIASANAAGVLVTQATPGFATSVSEWIIGMMINLSRHIPSDVADYQSGTQPSAKMGVELRGLTLGIIGFGTIARTLAPLAQAFGMKLMVADPYVTPPETFSGQFTALSQVLAEADFVVCLAPATPETTHLISAEAFTQMKPTAYFINASRGELVNEEDLYHALETEQLAGCAMDVGMGNDQTPSLKLAQHKKVLATPHIAGLTPQATQHQAMDIVEQIRALTHGNVPQNAVNLPHAYRAIEHFHLETNT